MHIQETNMHKAMSWALRNAVVSKGNVLALISQQDGSSTFNVRAVGRIPRGIRAQPLPQPLMTIGPHEMTSRPRTVPPSTALGRIFFERDRYLHAVRPYSAPTHPPSRGRGAACAWSRDVLRMSV